MERIKAGAMDADQVDGPPKKRRGKPRESMTGDLFSAPFTNSIGSKKSAKDMSVDTMKRRREQVYQIIRSSGSKGLARFEIANILGRPQNWITSSVDNLINVQESVIETDRSVYNPDSNRWCGVLVAVGCTHGSFEEVA